MLTNMANDQSTTLPIREQQPSLDDSEDKAHIVMKSDQMRGYIAGQPIKALCGKTWVPTRDYSGLPICKACERERDRIIAGMKGMN